MASIVTGLLSANEAVSAISTLLFGAKAGVLLGDFAFNGHEVPEYISIGGTQQLTVHKLPGGERVVDAMGPDEGDLEWSGTMFDGGPETRARKLDKMRAAGKPLALHWGSFFYTVVIKSFSAQTYYGRVQYKISCLVLRNEANSPRPGNPNLTGSVLGDIAAAVNTTAATLQPILAQAQTAVGALGKLIPGSQLLAQASGYLGQAGGSLAVAQSTANGALALTTSAAPAGSIVSGASDLTASTANSGLLAQAQQAAGYVGRAVRNLAP